MQKKLINVLFGQNKMMLFNKFLVVIWLNIMINSLKSENYHSQQVNICLKRQLSVLCVVNISLQHGNVYFVKKFHVKIVLIQDFIVKEIIEEAELFCILMMLNISFITRIVR